MKTSVLVLLLLLSSVSFGQLHYDLNSQLTFDLKFNDFTDYYVNGAKSMTYVKKSMIRDSSSYKSSISDSTNALLGYVVNPDNKEEKATIIYGENNRFEMIRRLREFELQINDSIVFHYSDESPYEIPSKMEYFKPIMGGSYLRLEWNQIYYKNQDSLVAFIVDSYRGGDTLRFDYYIVNDSSKLIRSRTFGHQFLNYGYNNKGDLVHIEGHSTNYDLSFIEVEIIYYSEGKTETKKTNSENIQIVTNYDNSKKIMSVESSRLYQNRYKSSSKTLYKYDKMGNWIEKIVIVNNERAFITTRSIEY